jgi:hypothetical protein
MTTKEQEMLDRSTMRIDEVAEGMMKRLKVFDQKKLSTEDIREIDAYKNGAGLVVKTNNSMRENFAFKDKTVRLALNALPKKRKSA